MKSKIRKFRRNLKAISPVISVLLMIAVAVVASLVVYAWVMGYIGFQTGKTGQAIQIQSVASSNPGGTGNLVVYVQNIGQGPITFNTPCVYVNGAAPTTQTPSQTGSIGVGSTVSFTTNYQVSSGTVVTVKVNSADGTFNSMTYTFP